MEKTGREGQKRRRNLEIKASCTLLCTADDHVIQRVHIHQRQGFFEALGFRSVGCVKGHRCRVEPQCFLLVNLADAGC